MVYSKYKVGLLILSQLIHYSATIPIPLVSQDGKYPGVSAVIPFLRKFGYLQRNSSVINDSHMDHEMLYTKDGIAEAIMEMQKFGALEQTGKLDNDTLALLSKPRCGVPDVVNHKMGNYRSKRYVIGANGWNKRQLTYRVDNWTPQLDEGTVLSDLGKAFAIWADYARLRFINKPRGNQDDADIQIAFGRGYHGDNYPFDGSGGVLAHAFFPYGHGSLGGDIHFDLDENWSSQSFKSPYTEESYNVSFLAVAVHEIGHSLGLAHSPSRDSVMFPYYQGYNDEGTENNVQLGYDDIIAMYQLYIQREITDYEDSNDNGTPLPSSTEHYATTTESFDIPSTTSTPDTTTRAGGNESESNVPNLCQDGFDTIAFIRNELFVFKDKYMWRFKDRGITEPYYPVEISRLFPMLSRISRVDAAFENDKGQLVFFSGKDYWMYDEFGITSGPFPITNFNLPGELDKVEAAFIWAKNQKLYIFSGAEFWRYDLANKSMDRDYPQGLGRWRGLPYSGIKSAMSWTDGKTYFFKNDDFWRFEDTKVHTDDGFPMKTASFWFNC